MSDSKAISEQERVMRRYVASPTSPARFSPPMAEMTVEILKDTPTQIYVQDGRSTAWLDKARIEINPPEGAGPRVVKIKLSEWLAMEKGLC